MRVSGWANVELVISETGDILGMTPRGNTDPEFRDAAIAAARQWRFKPALLNGEPVRAVFELTMRLDCGQSRCRVATFAE